MTINSNPPVWVDPCSQPGSGATAHQWPSPPPTNRGAANSKGGLDWLSFSCWVKHRDWQSLRSILAAARQDAQDRGELAGGLCNLPGGIVGRVRRKGFSGYVFCPFVIEIDGITIGFADRDTGDDQAPGVVVTITGEPCLIHGARWCSDRVDEVFAKLGIEVIRESVSRIDMATDLPGRHVSTFIMAWLNGQKIGRAKKYAIFGDTDLQGAQTLALGRGEAEDGQPLSVIFYDKLTETQHNETKRSYMVSDRWNGLTPEAATRVEFTVRTEALREMQVTTREQMWEQLPAIAKYLTHEWIRFSEKPVDRDNTTRAETAAWWVEVQQFTEEWAGKADKAAKREHRAVGTADLFKQAAGCLASAFVRQGWVVKNGPTLMRALKAFVEDQATFLAERIDQRSIAAFIKGDKRMGFAVEKQNERWAEVGTAIEENSPMTWGYSPVMVAGFA